MTINPVFTDAVPITAIDGERQFLDDALAGLSAPQKFLSAKYFYDAAGSDLFEAITRLPEYYPTRTELGILDAQGRPSPRPCPPAPPWWNSAAAPPPRFGA